DRYRQPDAAGERLQGLHPVRGRRAGGPDPAPHQTAVQTTRWGHSPSRLWAHPLAGERSPLTGFASTTKPVGVVTRGTTGYNRLRRSDRWLVYSRRVRTALQAAADPLVIDLGYGAIPVTTLELAARLRVVRADVRVVGLEIHPERLAAAARAAGNSTVEFALGGFELAGRRPV